MDSAFRPFFVSTILLACTTAGCALLGGRVSETPAKVQERSSVLVRSQVWRPTNVASLNLRRGPQGPGAFPFLARVTCRYDDKALSGHSPKFACVIGKGDDVKVKFGRANGEVYGEVLATRLLWALGFGADRMYPVKVVCRGCPEGLGGERVASGAFQFDPAVIERKMAGAEWPRDGKQGWSWNELNVVNRASGGAPRAHTDALKLLAVFLQHTDSKAEQQRIVCLGSRSTRDGEACRNPFLIINDLGLTFGRANRANSNEKGSVNLVEWRRTPVWKDDVGCTGNLPKSFSGTLENPEISESGRHFLASLLSQLSDRQLRDLFEVARVQLRPRSPGDPSSGTPTIEEWVHVFKEKRAQIVERRCT